MRKTLLSASALACAGALAVGPASAADMLSIGVGGYMEQWVGMVDRTDGDIDGGINVQSDSEIHFRGSLEADNGMKFTVHVELEANNEDDKGEGGGGDNTEIDESFVRVSGDFGTIEIGQRDPIHARTHYAAAFGAGVGLNAGDTQKWIPGAYFETAGWTIPGDDLGIIYITPRVNGIQVGLSYHPDSTNENASTRAPENNDNAAVAGGINYNVAVADMSVKVSLGHVAVSQPDNDDKTYTNAGLSVGMGAFGLGVSYADRDDNDAAMKNVHETVAVGISYTDGPMTLSADYMNRDAENGDERTGTMVSMGYKLAPGVDWKSSVFGVEDTGSGAEGTAFVTGIDIHF